MTSARLRLEGQVRSFIPLITQQFWLVTNRTDCLGCSSSSDGTDLSARSCSSGGTDFSNCSCYPNKTGCGEIRPLHSPSSSSGRKLAGSSSVPARMSSNPRTSIRLLGLPLSLPQHRTGQVSVPRRLARGCDLRHTTNAGPLKR
jgi:hypothetical protein